MIFTKYPKILVTSHISPDPDAISSALFTYKVLKHNFPELEVEISFEDSVSETFDFLVGFEHIQHINFLDKIDSFEPDLVVFTDSQGPRRVTKAESKIIEERLAKAKPFEGLIIDHHERVGIYKPSTYINYEYSSAVHTCYEFLIHNCGLDTYPAFAETALLGIITDTGRFLFPDKHRKETFEQVLRLELLGAKINEIESRLSKVELVNTKILSHLLQNLQTEHNYSFSFLSEECFVELKKQHISKDTYSVTRGNFNNIFLTKITGFDYGFMVSPDFDTLNMYSVSFRGLEDSVDTTLFTSKLGGGGHKGASAARFEAKSLEDAIYKVKQAIQKSI
jgi:bifunctional oligoribonuclease and PAP phosphatase NrnA